MRKSAPLRWPQFLACSYALAAALLAHARSLPLPFFGLLVATLTGRVVLRHFSPARAILPLRLALLALFGFAVVSTFHHVFGREAGSGLLAAMLVLKLVEAETRRDGLVLVAVGCFLTMAAFLYDQGIAQTTGAAIALVISIAALHALQPYPDSEPAEASRGGWWPFADLALGNSLRLLLLATPFAAACFVFFPRFDAPLWGAPEDAFRGRTGLSDRMEPGMLSGVALDDRAAFQITFDGAAPAAQDRYYRVYTLWSFDGSAWLPSEWLARSTTPSPQATSPRIAYEVVLEPTDQRWLPVLDSVIQAPHGARVLSDYQVRVDHPINAAFRFNAVSATHIEPEPLLQVIRRAALSLPPGAGPRATALAREWRAAAGRDDRAVIDRAIAMYRATFHYSLESPPARGDAVDDFLFETQTGFCEHFSSSFTFLMRAAGIPARVVTGYQGGIYNSLGNFWLLRNSDAHAWSEVWLDGRGWVRVDPTAAVAPERIESGSLSRLREQSAWYSRGGIWSALRERFDYLGYWWNRTIIEYTALRQRELMRDFGVDDPDWTFLGKALVASSIVALLVAGAVSRLRRRERRDELLAAYRAYCDRLAREGVVRGSNEGPVAFGERAAAALPASAEAIRMLSGGFARLRYAQSAVDAAERRLWMSSARRFRPARAATARRSRTS